jgi:hypothetical protein
VGVPLRRPDHFVLHFLPLLAPFSLPLSLPFGLVECPCVGDGFFEGGSRPFAASPTDGTDGGIAVMRTVTAAAMRLLRSPINLGAAHGCGGVVEATVLLLTRHNV